MDLSDLWCSLDRRNADPGLGRLPVPTFLWVSFLQGFLGGGGVPPPFPPDLTLLWYNKKADLRTPAPSGAGVSFVYGSHYIFLTSSALN